VENSTRVSQEQRMRFLKAYFGRFYVQVKKEKREQIKKEIEELDSFFLYKLAPSSELTKFGAVALSLWGKSYHKILSYELLTMYLDEGVCFYEHPTDFLIILHLKDTPPNKFLPHLIQYTATHRMEQGKRTLVLSEVKIPGVSAVRKEKEGVLECPNTEVF